jgi:hypothetical protein
MNRLTFRLAALAFGALALSAHAQVTLTNFNLSNPSIAVFNDRIGNSRFFAGPNTDRVRVSDFQSPSPDSDVFIATNSAGLQFRSLNGGATVVTMTHPSFGALLPDPRPLTFVGLTSPGGGGRNEFTTSFNRANPVVAPLLDAWAATPFIVTASNPLAPNGITSITVNAPPFDKDAMPGFVTDLTVTGGGVAPRLDWLIPAGIVPSAVSLQVRRINSENADRTRITSATLVHVRNLAPTATSYTFGERFSNADLPGFPAGLVVGEKYEIAVQIDLATGGALKGRSRTLFEFTPLSGTSSGVAVFLPSIGPDGAFKFDITVSGSGTVVIDPEVAVGYIYEVGAGDPNFRSVSLPAIGDGRFTIEVFDAALGAYRPGFAASANTTYDFIALGHPDGVAKFRVKGIEASAGLDPTNTTAFLTTVGFTAAGRFTGTMVPVFGYALGGLRSPVNLPPTLTTTRAGATLPLKWTIADRQGFAVTDLAAVSSITYKPASCTAFPTEPAGGADANAAGGSALRYDAPAAQYVFNWKTPGTPGCYALFVTLDTAQVLQANVMLTP